MIILTGGTGFIGQQLVRKLVEQNHLVAILSRDVIAAKNVFAIHGKNVLFYKYDSSLDSLEKVFKEHGNRIEGIIHLATHFTRGQSLRDTDDLLAANIQLGSRLLALSQENAAKYFLYMSSYWQDDQEGHYKPTSLYTSTKEAFKCIAEFYRLQKKMCVLGLKLYDVVGESDMRDHKLISTLYKKYKGRDLSAFPMTQGEQYINLLHVDDAVSGILNARKLILQSAELASEYYLPGHKIQLKEYIKNLESALSFDFNVKWGAVPYPKNMIKIPYVGESLPNWSPSKPLNEIIARIAQWVKN